MVVVARGRYWEVGLVGIAALVLVDEEMNQYLWRHIVIRRRIVLKRAGGLLDVGNPLLPLPKESGSGLRPCILCPCIDEGPVEPLKNERSSS